MATARQVRFELTDEHHKDARVMRAKTELSMEGLWVDMMRVYKAHPKEWSSAKKQAKAVKK